jgi:transcription initiation factor TFIIIB Brf1 subunit/transcription initiation factor TFIIB
MNAKKLLTKFNDSTKEKVESEEGLVCPKCGCTNIKKCPDGTECKCEKCGMKAECSEFKPKEKTEGSTENKNKSLTVDELSDLYSEVGVKTLSDNQIKSILKELSKYRITINSTNAILKLIDQELSK